MFCSRHPSVDTVLSCARCGMPICTSCLVPTSVGNRCVLCSRPRGDSTQSISAWTIVKAYTTATLIAVFFSLVIFIAKVTVLNVGTKIQTITFVWDTFVIISGFLIGEVISLVSSRKKGMVLKFAPLYGVSMVLLGMLFTNVMGLRDLLNLFGVASVLIALAVSVRKF